MNEKETASRVTGRFHEVYKFLITGGFTQDEALTLIAKLTKPKKQK